MKASTKLSNTVFAIKKTTLISKRNLHTLLTHISCHNLTPAYFRKHRILKNICNNPNIISTKSDKQNGIVILDRLTYRNSCLQIINLPKFTPLDEDPTLSREAKLRLLRKLRKKGSIDNEVYNYIFPKGSQPFSVYALPKLHKKRKAGQPPPLRPKISSTNACNYNLAKYFSSILTPLIPVDHSTKNSFSSSMNSHLSTHQLHVKNFFISYDVESLFTNIPLTETIDLAIDTIFTDKPKFTMTKTDLT